MVLADWRDAEDGWQRRPTVIGVLVPEMLVVVVSVAVMRLAARRFKDDGESPRAVG